ncbi:COP9 signalosome complex subunit 6 isoform X1 [Lingula anatina]|uniref:COP9 signalosome complex subunit 6 n=1 Tax=Lingula anatina TaxID=7574 RepID=A0A1S3I5P5_LINAN|nr:COP9 signalosome complex subunit 6-like isoform X1 [Lingula anatina]XP_013418523.1 COP9 signalosome complex subunit 6 isoform X1 [Lingula anatina]|eukprot:XP_013393595.1 COP9 signalosome complex subunit 6-like isoform X1 [Lingula anatina]
MASKMEVDAAPSNVMASSSLSGSVSVQLHPLVIMNISEHWTRVRAQEGKPVKILGALIGKQHSRNIEVMNSFELMFDIVEGDTIIDREYYTTKEEQFKQVFSDMDFLGWYTTGEMPDESDITVHRQVCDINESPIFLKLSPVSRQADQLPVSVYESVIDLVNGVATMLFVELQYTLATEEAERIGVDHVARVSSSESAENSLVSEHLTAQHNAIKMLHGRVKVILDYLKAVQAGEVPKNHEILRETYSLCHRLPVLRSEKFKEDFFNQCNDVSLMTYLGTLTKGCNTINQFVNKFNVLYDRQGMGRRMRGLFF